MKVHDFGTIGVVSLRYCIPTRGKGFDAGVELTKFFSGRNDQIVLYCLFGWAVENRYQHVADIECEARVQIRDIRKSSSIPETVLHCSSQFLPRHLVRGTMLFGMDGVVLVHVRDELGSSEMERHFKLV